MFLSRKSITSAIFDPMDVLQWGRDVSIPEMRGCRRQRRSGCPASMGPGCFYPGNLQLLERSRQLRHVALQWGRDVSIPEMGRSLWMKARQEWLQWGRDVSIPEILVLARALAGPTGLQWGRDVSIPEIATHYSILFSRTYAPVRERLSILSPISTPEPSATPLTPAAPQLYRSASPPRSMPPAPPLAPDYRVVNTGYSAISPSNTRANSRAWISSNRR